jgi:hypothetical protein
MKYKGQLKGFPEHIVNMMLDNQEAQGNKRDVMVFKESKGIDKRNGGFNWSESQFGYSYWHKVIQCREFDTPTPKSPQEIKIELLIKKQESIIARFNSDVIAVTLCEDFIKDLKYLQND